MKEKRFAVVGATGMVGKSILEVLYQKNVPHKNIVAVASEKSQGQKLAYGDKFLITHSLENFSFKNVDIALFSPGSAISKIYAPKAVQEGCIVIDNTSAFRMDDNTPLIVPEINGNLLNCFKPGVISNPNCSTIQMLMALKPIHELFKVKKVIVSTYQAVSGAGQKAVDVLENQTKALLDGKEISKSECFPKQIGFNAIPRIDQWADLDYTKEEWKMINETKKILDPSIEVVPTCVRVPVKTGHALSVHIDCVKEVSLEDLKRKIDSTPGIKLMDNPQHDVFTTPIDCVGDDDVYISRLRFDPFSKNALQAWIVADNIRKGAATNAVQIAELLYSAA